MIDFDKFTAGVLSTESPRRDLSAIDQHLRSLHASMGLVTEAGELMDTFKRTIFYGTLFDRTNLIEELGDLAYYLALMCDANNINMQDVLDTNSRKLKARYPNKFSEDAANNRDLVAERFVLEGITDATV